MTSRFLIALTCTVALTLAACGDDEDPIIADGNSGTTADESADASGGGEDDFCTLLIENNDAPLSEFPAFAERFKAAAPPEIADDVATSIDAFLALTETDLSEATDEAIAAAEAQFEASAEASDRVEAWVAANCDALPPGFFS